MEQQKITFISQFGLLW
uniref:Uncharacterized protein n=1 Tax=Arundo donax TaxID=35708 RepID=A0A0A9EMB7_ARUDO